MFFQINKTEKNLLNFLIKINLYFIIFNLKVINKIIILINIIINYLFINNKNN